MKEMKCSHCGSTEFTDKDDKRVCDYCHAMYDLPKKKLGAFDYLLASQKQAQEQDEKQSKSDMIVGVGIIFLFAVIQ